MLLRPGPASSWGLALLLCLCAVLLLMLAAPTAHGQTESSSEPPSLSANYSEAEQTLTLLLDRLNERRLQVQLLQSNLSEADARLATLLQNLQDLQTLLQETQESYNKQQMDLTVTSNSLAALSLRYAELETRWQAYRDEMVKQVSDVTRDYQRARRWAVGFGVATVVGVVVSVLLALR